ncbi:hypothetical protein LIER_34578 [Lithospermum erythrorhizon]|uniref:ATP-dependent DNA helicase n=1 Tax=Lithospermum erythrorhizon TaxID=34254 RepID=A0AAV3S2Q4_LITER
MAEKSIPIPEEDLHAMNYLNVQQTYAFDTIFNTTMMNTGGAFFIDGPGGTGKSFLYKVLLAHIRSKGYIALIVASSGIASSGFLGGRTAHSRFKIPIDAGPKVKCQISFQRGEADLIRSFKIIIWDEAPMADKTVVLALDKLLKDLCENTKPSGGKLAVFGGDFWQVLPVVRRDGRKEQVQVSIVSSTLWKYFIRIELTDNMRARTDPTFVDFLMRIGNGEEPTNSRGEIEIPEPMLIPYTNLEQSIEALINIVYPNMRLFEEDPFEMMKRTILCPKSEYMDNINSRLIQRISGKEVLYISDDQAKKLMDQGDYVDYLNSLEPRGQPQHKLLLKINSPVILLRNINHLEALCNGTRYLPSTTSLHSWTTLCNIVQSEDWKKCQSVDHSPICNDPGTKYTTNVIYNEVLLQAKLN